MEYRSQSLPPTDLNRAPSTLPNHSCQQGNSSPRCTYTYHANFAAIADAYGLSCRALRRATAVFVSPASSG